MLTSRRQASARRKYPLTAVERVVTDLRLQHGGLDQRRDGRRICARIWHDQAGPRRRRPTPPRIRSTIALAAGSGCPRLRTATGEARRGHPAHGDGLLGVGLVHGCADQPLTRSTALSTARASCTNGTRHRTDNTRCAGTIQSVVPRNVPRGRPRVGPRVGSQSAGGSLTDTASRSVTGKVAH